MRAIGLPFTHFRALENARRAALAGAITIGVTAISGFPDFGWLEASQLLLALSALRVVARQLEEAPFPSPFHDGTLLAAAGIWTVVVTVFNAIDGSPGGTNAIVILGGLLLLLAGLRMRTINEQYWFE
ncbi:MAG: hypothetical protein WAP35_04695 [Solirubrobacterales bacterium]